MVVHKSDEYGSSGDRVPRMPHVPRSAKGKRSVRKKSEDNEMCAFDILATVAGKLLETEDSATPFSSPGTSNPTSAKVKQELSNEGKSPVAKELDYRSCNNGALGSDGQGIYNANGHLMTSSTPSGCSSVFVKPDTSEKNAFARKSLVSDKRVEVGHALGTVLEKCSIDRRSPDSMYCLQALLQAEVGMSGNLIHRNVSGMCSMEDAMDVDAKPPALVSSESSAEVPPGGVHMSNCFVSKHREHLEDVVVRDRNDDDNSSGCTHPSTMPSKAFRPQRVGDRRIRKLLGSKYWKVAPTTLKDRELSDSEVKPVYRSRRMCYTRQRTQRSAFKRVKQFERRTISTSDGRMCREVTSDLPLKGSIKLEASESHATLHGANRASSSTSGQKTSYGEEDLHVQFSIKSFKVPELFIEIPESATVGSLKRTVMEAVNAILGSGLRVGVHLQGKKVRDDNKTLAQAGISHDEKLENLGFTLELNPTPAPPSCASPEDKPILFPCDATEHLTRISTMVPPTDQGASSAIMQPPLVTEVNCPESDHDSVHSTPDVSSLDKTDTYANALVPVPAASTEPLDVVPLRKSRRSELVQRRIRRPFSVTEVEALVQAVEKLGTGRWRDVKIRAFDNAKHRTYVDLKDKWKTLVHTARISPQQRRGEPVPQNLLDRVLAAHAFWTQQQAKLQIKSPPTEACLLL